eukprot:TRINITY_DN12075_c0_g1_i4.p1 TRINITY_DN12075_c0_g1~~TRINITY_DN12075_c0_g1_i4.p1  ORF type:complete len:461 (+),score=-46.41 TRINITY_DN12075_c0_g1_i4:559-1941(+)
MHILTYNDVKNTKFTSCFYLVSTIFFLTCSGIFQSVPSLIQKFLLRTRFCIFQVRIKDTWLYIDKQLHLSNYIMYFIYIKQVNLFLTNNICIDNQTYLTFVLHKQDQNQKNPNIGTISPKYIILIIVVEHHLRNFIQQHSIQNISHAQLLFVYKRVKKHELNMQPSKITSTKYMDKSNTSPKYTNEQKHSKTFFKNLLTLNSFVYYEENRSTSIIIITIILLPYTKSSMVCYKNNNNNQCQKNCTQTKYQIECTFTQIARAVAPQKLLIVSNVYQFVHIKRYIYIFQLQKFETRIQFKLFTYVQIDSVNNYNNYNPVQSLFQQTQIKRSKNHYCIKIFSEIFLGGRDNFVPTTKYSEHNHIVCKHNAIRTIFMVNDIDNNIEKQYNTLQHYYQTQFIYLTLNFCINIMVLLFFYSILVYNPTNLMITNPQRIQPPTSTTNSIKKYLLSIQFKLGAKNKEI